jgi:hypothetical protein
MTNYRITICKYHDQPQFNFCFDCGAPLKFEPKSNENEFDTLTCSRHWVHCRIFLEEHDGDVDETDCPERVVE